MCQNPENEINSKEKCVELTEMNLNDEVKVLVKMW